MAGWRKCDRSGGCGWRCSCSCSCGGNGSGGGSGRAAALPLFARPTVLFRPSRADLLPLRKSLFLCQLVSQSAGRVGRDARRDRRAARSYECRVGERAKERTDGRRLRARRLPPPAEAAQQARGAEGLRAVHYVIASDIWRKTSPGERAGRQASEPVRTAKVTPTSDSPSRESIVCRGSSRGRLLFATERPRAHQLPRPSHPPRPPAPPLERAQWTEILPPC